MQVRARYFKEIEIIDDATEEEIKKFDTEGMPARFDGMADEVDNKKPLLFLDYEIIDESYKEEKKRLKRNERAIIICFALFFDATISFVLGIIYKNPMYGVFTFFLYWPIWIGMRYTLEYVKKHRQKKDIERKRKDN